MTQEIYRVFKYFKLFSYAPSAEELYMFTEKRAPKAIFDRDLAKLVKERRVLSGAGMGFSNTFEAKYTLGEYSIFLKNSKRFGLYSQSKLKKAELFCLLAQFFPQIRLIGITGSLSMMHAGKEDDIDICVITAKNRMWTARFLANLIAFGMGAKRKVLSEQAKDKICLNLFFDESDLEMPSFKKTKYVAHELFQMKPVVNKEGVYTKLLKANLWAFRIFPNARIVLKNYIKPQHKAIKYRRSSLGDWFERILKVFQLRKIRKNQTKEIVRRGQLWFFPDDFEAKILKYNRG